MRAITENPETWQPFAVGNPRANPQAARIWENIERLFKRRGWKPSELADKAEIPRPTVSRWQHSVPKPENLQRVAAVLGVSVDQLISEDETPRPKIEPVGHLNAHEDRVIRAMRADEGLAKVIHKLVKEWSDEDN